MTAFMLGGAIGLSILVVSRTKNPEDALRAALIGLAALVVSFLYLTRPM